MKTVCLVSSVDSLDAAVDIASRATVGSIRHDAGVIMHVLPPVRGRGAKEDTANLHSSVLDDTQKGPNVLIPLA